MVVKNISFSRLKVLCFWGRRKDEGGNQTLFVPIYPNHKRTKKPTYFSAILEQPVGLRSILLLANSITC